jgi:hypothetical protein
MESFDFKEFLVNKDDPEHRERLCATATAFANSKGGFIIFGVADINSPKRGLDRLVGINVTGEPAKLFEDQVKPCQPSISYEFKNPPVVIPKSPSKIIFIVKIPKSLYSPHAFIKHNKFLFYKRTHQGNAPMTFTELDKAFAIKAGAVGKLTLLHWQLAAIVTNLKIMKNTTYDKKTKQASGPLMGPDNILLDVAICDLFPLISDDAELLLALSRISVACRAMRVVVDEYRLRIPLSPEEAVTHFNKLFHPRLPILETSIATALKILEDRYGVKTNPIAELERSNEKQVNTTE